MRHKSIKIPDNKTDTLMTENRTKQYNSHDHKDKRLVNICENVLVSKPYINYEYKVKINEYIKNKTNYENDSLVRLKSMHQYITDAMNVLLTDNGFVDKSFDIVIAKSHGETNNGKYYTFFYRFIVNGPFRFKNTYDAKQLVDIIN